MKPTNLTSTSNSTIHFNSLQGLNKLNKKVTDLQKPYALERLYALEAVSLACKLCLSVQSKLISEDTVTKKDRSPVTIADYASQAVVSYILSQAFPNDPIVGEEDAK